MFCARNTPLPQQTPHHTSRTYKFWTHAHTTVSPQGVWKWQTVLAMSTNGHFNALEVKGLVLRGHLHRAVVFNARPTKRSVSKGGRVWWMMRLPHTCTQGPQYVPSPPISPRPYPNSPPVPSHLLASPPIPIDPLYRLSIRTPHPCFIFGGSASHAELTRGACWVRDHRISLHDWGRMPQTEPQGLPLPRVTLLLTQAVEDSFRNIIPNSKVESVFQTLPNTICVGCVLCVNYAPHTELSSLSGCDQPLAIKWAGTNIPGQPEF